MAWYQETEAEAKLKVLIRHLVLSFPQASILSWQVGRGDHVFLIVPYDGSLEKTIQVETAVFQDQNFGVQEFASLLCRLDLCTALDRCDRYDLNFSGRYQEWAVAGQAHSARHIQRGRVREPWTGHQLVP